MALRKRKPPTPANDDNDDVRLHEVENPWRRGRRPTDVGGPPSDVWPKTLRRLLNKLASRRFDASLPHVETLDVDAPERLWDVVHAVCDRVFDEPHFSVAYARMCAEVDRVLTTPDHSLLRSSFHNLLTARCQEEFEERSRDKAIRNGKLMEIEECTDPERRKDLQFDLEEMRTKSIAHVRFVGGLFNHEIETTATMLRHLTLLLNNCDDESIELLCILLTAVGEKLDSRGVDLSTIFRTLTEMAATRESMRIRFVLREVIDMRNSNWRPIEEIRKKADQERIVVATMTKPKRERQRRKDGVDWRKEISVAKNYLHKMSMTDEPLGSSVLFASWGKGSTGSNIKTSAQTMRTNIDDASGATSVSIATSDRPNTCPVCLLKVGSQMMRSHLMKRHRKHFCAEFKADKVLQIISSGSNGEVYFVLDDKWCSLEWFRLLSKRHQLIFTRLDEELGTNLHILHSNVRISFDLLEDLFSVIPVSEPLLEI